MKKLLNWVINTCIILSMIIPSGFSGNMLISANASNVREITNTGMFRTTIQLDQAYDLTRLNKLDVVVLAQDGMQVDLLVTELQLEYLSRLGFEPAATTDVGLLIEANQDTYSWLQIALKEKIDQASVLVEENRLSDETTSEINDLAVLHLLKSFSTEQLAGIQALPGVDNDADGLTDTQESWWCTDPNNGDSDSDGRSDYVEIQAIKDWMANRSAVAPGETPWASWPFNTTTCPDKDYDSIPNLAERWELGLNMDLESTDRDKFDDGQEVFGVTYCPGGDYSCGYGDLPRSSDAGYVGQFMPAWVKAPGNHPLVAAFPFPEISLEPSSLYVEAVTIITTDHIISTGTENSYSTAMTEGISTSISTTETWNSWQQVSFTTEMDINNIIGLENLRLFDQHDANLYLANTTVSLIELGVGALEVASCFVGSVPTCLGGIALLGASAIGLVTQQLEQMDDIQSEIRINNIESTLNDHIQNPTDDQDLNVIGAFTESQDAGLQGGGTALVQNSEGSLSVSNYFPMTYPVFQPSRTDSAGSSRGGSQTNTHSEYEEQTITNGEAFSNEESWGTATAVDSSHAADLWFSYTVENNGTDYAREIANLAFNIYLNDDPNPIATYFVGPDLGADPVFRNFQPGEAHTYTSRHIPLTLEQMKQIDLGGKLRVVVEDFSFGADELFFDNALTGNVQLAVEDGVEDGDESIDRYLIPAYTGEMVTDILGRYFPHTSDSEGDLVAVWTPEYRQDIPTWCGEPWAVGTGANSVIWCKHALTTADWWNIYTDNMGDGSLPLQETPAISGATALFRFNADSDLDGYSDHSEVRLNSDPYNASSFPRPELIAGIQSIRSGNNVVSTLSLLNTGLYDAYGVEAVMIAANDSITITNNTVGGSGRVRAGKEVVVGSRISSPDYSDTTWTGTAKPVSGGYFTGNTDLTYSFAISCTIPSGCVVGQDLWSLNWSDGTNSGTVAFDGNYNSPNPVSIGMNGLQLSFISGTVMNGNTFTVSAHTPRDTFQYSINYEPYTEPIVIVSYNDPQSNHRFVLPEATMNLMTPSDDLVPFSGNMLDINGVEITTTTQFLPGSNSTKVVVDNPTEKTIQDGHLFLEFIDPDGTVALEVPVTQDFNSGPNIVDIAWDTAGFIPAYDPEQDYIVMAFWTDYEGNILDTSGRPLSSFQADPQPEFAITAADENWDFGTASQGTILKREFSFANTGERTLLTYVDAPAGLMVSQTGSKLIGPADMATYEITLNTTDLPVGEYSELVTIHTSDLANPIRTIAITGSITTGEASLPALIDQLPLDYAVTVPGPQSVGNWHSFTHTIGPEPQTIHPVKVYSQDYSILWGMGKYAYEFGTGTGGFSLFGDGRNGNLTVTSGQTLTLNTTFANITGSAGSTTATVSSSTNFSIGDLVLIHQTQGTSDVGKWEYNFIASISGTTWTLARALMNTYSNSSGKAQVIKIPQYHNVTVQSGGTITTPSWDGSTGGITAFVANGTVTVAGTITANGSGYRLGDRGEYLDPIRSQGWQGESTIPGSAQTRNNNVGGGGGGNGDNDSSCGDDKCEGAGGGGGGYGTGGTSGQNSSTVFLGGLGGTVYGTGNLLSSVTFGSGGGGGGSDGDNATKYGGYGGSGGGILFISGQQVNITGPTTSNGNNGLSGASHDNARTGGGGGGSGGSILITGSNVTLGGTSITTLGGIGGVGLNGGGNGGNGGLGRIYVQYCETISGSTNPAAVTNKISCHISEQVETSPYTTTRLQIPESFTSPQTYAIKYGRRLVFSAPGSQTTTLQLPAGYLKSAELDVLISNAGVGDLTISMDIGSNGSTDYTWTGSVSNLISQENIAFTTAYNQWWSTASKQLTGSVDVPVTITLSKAAQILLTDLKVSTYGSSLNHIQLQSGSYSEVELNIKASGTTDPLSLGIDVGDDGVIDQEISTSSPLDPHYVTSTNLASQVNAYLSELSGLVEVPIRLFFYHASQAGISDFSASIIGNKDVSLSVSDITLPASDPMETDVVPVSATFHNSGNLPSGNFTAGFFASTPDVGEWYIGSALLPSVMPGQSATAEISWNTSGFVGQTSVKAVADPFDHILETNEENNQAVDDIYVRTRPDLSVTAIDPSDPEPKTGELIQISVVEKNLGETDTSLSTLGIYDGNPDEGGTLIGEQSAGLIGGSETSFTFDWQPLTTGWHRLYVKPDVADVIDEFDEENNLFWQDIYVGLSGSILLDSGTTNDPVYTQEGGFGYTDINSPDQITICSLGNLAEDTIRRDPDGSVVYQFDHLLPGHFYHLDVTLYECDGAGRQEYILVDDNQIAGPEDLGDSQVHRLSLRLDPALYADRSVRVAINADGIDGAVVSEVNLHDIDYRYADAGGGDDPQYPGDEGYGWIDGDAITTWGVLPYRSVRVDQIDSELRYQFDNLNPDKHYNVHFTFWQPAGTGRVLKVQVDGIDTGLTVNTGDYVRHQEKISIPINAYSTDGSVMISIVRTNATTGAMVNEIALEEETVSANVGCVVLETPYFSETYGSVLIEDLDAPAGSVIQALNPRGDTVGCFTITTEGSYGFMRIYGEDTSETPIIPGMRVGEMVEYRVNGAPAMSSPLFYWSDDHAAHNVNLNSGNIIGQSILLNTGWNLVSFKIEPPTPLVSTVLNSIRDRYSRVLGENGIYVPTLPDEFNTLRELHTANGYYIRIIGTTSVSLLVEGIAQDCSTPKELHAGWNWIGAPCSLTATVEALQSISGYYQRVLSLNKTYDPALPEFSTLLNLTPGEGYLIYLTESATLIYPAQGTHIVEYQPVNDLQCSSLHPTPNSTLIYGLIQFGGNPAPKGTIVEFLTPGGDVAGCGTITQDGLLLLTQAFGKVDEAEDIGFVEGEPISIRLRDLKISKSLGIPWTDDKLPHEILVDFNVFSTFIPIIQR
jgi:hypothetical protein